MGGGEFIGAGRGKKHAKHAVNNHVSSSVARDRAFIARAPAPAFVAARCARRLARNQ